MRGCPPFLCSSVLSLYVGNVGREAAERGSAAIQRWGRDGGGAEPLIPFFLPVLSSPLLDAEGR